MHIGVGTHWPLAIDFLNRIFRAGAFLDGLRISDVEISLEGPGNKPSKFGRGPLFPPRPDRRRMPLPEVHRRLSEWLRCAAIREFIASGLIYRYCSRKLQL